MLNASELRNKIGAYASGDISLGAFEDWFYEESIDPIEDDELADLAASVDEALSARHFGHLEQSKLRCKLQELATAIGPFVLSKYDHSRKVFEIVLDERQGNGLRFVATAAASVVLLSISVSSMGADNLQLPAAKIEVSVPNKPPVHATEEVLRYRTAAEVA